MEKLIKAGALMDAFRKYMAENYDRERCVSEDACKLCERGCMWRKVVSAAPAVDAEEVVRCKDCTFCAFNSSNETFKCRSMNGMYRTVGPDDFCSYGERGTDV